MRTGLLVLLILTLAAFPAAAGADDELERLTVEYAHEPLGLDVEQPRFGWRLERDVLQRAYQVQVASSEHALRSGRADVWDSGRVESGDSAQVAYGGAPLQPATRYHWRVRVWTGDRASSWSTSEWETGLLGEAAWRGARWIGRGEDGAAPRLRREFRLDERVERARLYVSGLGHYEARINGERVGDQVLDPGHTDYDDSVLYAAHDVTRLVRRGANALGVELGTGWYDVRTGNVWDWHNAP